MKLVFWGLAFLLFPRVVIFLLVLFAIIRIVMAMFMIVVSIIEWMLPG